MYHGSLILMKILFIRGAQGKGKLVETEKMDVLLQNVEKIQGTLNELMTVTKDRPVPLGLRGALQEGFQCCICRSTPLKPPIICHSVVKRCSAALDAQIAGTAVMTPLLRHVPLIKGTMRR